jgi:hypothetical protein
MAYSPSDASGGGNMKRLMIAVFVLIMSAAYSGAWIDPGSGRYTVCWTQRWMGYDPNIGSIIATVCDGPWDVFNDISKDHNSICPGGRGKDFNSYNDAIGWMRQNCTY